MNAQHLQEAADQWNTSHPVGTPVTRYRLINPLREPVETKTRSAAWVMGSHSVMVMVEGISGGVLLESVKLIHPTTRQTIVANSTTPEMKSKFKTLRNMDIGTDDHQSFPVKIEGIWSDHPGSSEATAGLEGCPIESLKNCVSTHVRDWSTNKRDAWIYGIVCGWDDDCFEELMAIHKWTPEKVARLKNLHEIFQGVGKTQEHPTNENGLRWHKLTELTVGDRVIEVMAATCDDGIGVIARWTRNADDSWKVTAMDTEGGEWETVRIFGDEETVPPEPPSHWDDIQKNSKIHP